MVRSFVPVPNQDLTSTNHYLFSFVYIYNYRLLTFMTMNEFGEGTVVEHSLLEANGDWYMDKTITHFMRVHPARIMLLRVFMVDKYMNEIRVLEIRSPEACVLICHFHVITYLNEMVQAKRVFFYDLLDQAPYKNACMILANHLDVSGLKEYDVVAQNTP
jgi:hypothetical protein